MPFTPFHLGPGLAIKALAGRRVSLIAFGLAQVAMDIEPLVGMARDAEVLHGPTHTYLAALLIALPAALAARVIGPPLLARWNRELAAARLGWLATAEPLTAGSVAAGALLGTLSHVVLDSFMHADMAPLAPWSRANGLFAAISIDALYAGCAAAGAAGLLAWLAARWRARRRAPAASRHD